MRLCIQLVARFFLLVHTLHTDSFSSTTKEQATNRRQKHARIFHLWLVPYGTCDGRWPPSEQLGHMDKNKSICACKSIIMIMILIILKSLAARLAALRCMLLTNSSKSFLTVALVAEHGRPGTKTGPTPKCKYVKQN